MKLFDLTGKVAVITGSSRGIGRAMAETFAEAGAKLVISGRNLQLNRLPIPGIVHAQAVMPRRHRHRDRVPVKQFPDALSIQLHYDLTLLYIFR